MIVIKNKFIPFKGYETINLFGLLFTRGEIDDFEYNHEAIHTEQIIECTVLSMFILIFINILFNINLLWGLLAPFTFYILYGIEYVIIRLFHNKQNDAYHDVSFEEEAYNNTGDLTYIKYRHPFAWIKYVKLKSN